MAEGQREAKITPEVEPLSELLAHPLLQDPKFVAAAVGLLLLVVLVTVFRPKSKTVGRSGPATVLLVGPSDGGKTSLFAKLVHGTYPQTHTSVVPSSTVISLDDSSRQIRLVDLPGHPRLRDEVKKRIPEADAVVFVVDIVGLVRNAATIAEEIPFILTTLANASYRQNRTSRFILLAHKTDLLIRPSPPAYPCPPDITSQTLQTAHERLKSILTREMDRLKAARGSTGGRIEGMSRVSGTGGGWWSRLFGTSAAAAGEADGEGEEDESLIWGEKGGFRWEDVEGVDVEWAASGLGMVHVIERATDKEENDTEGNGLDELKALLGDL